MLNNLFRRRRGLAPALVLVALGALVVVSAASANTVQLSGSMEGAVTITPGDDVAAGYIFKTDAKAPTTVSFVGGQITFSGNCSTGGTGSLQITIPTGTYAVAPGGGSYPTGDEKDPASFEGSVVAPSTMCPNGGKLDASKGASFSADVQSPDTTQNVSVQFHYRDPNAKGKGNYDCSASTSASLGADVCGASWSATAQLHPDSPPPPPPPTCAANQTLVNGVCQNNPPTCSANQTLVNGVCQNSPPVCTTNCGGGPPTCSASQTLVNGTCQNNPPVCTTNCGGGPPTCSANQTLVNGTCQNNPPTCTSNQALVNGTCQNNPPPPPSCTTGQTTVDGACRTPQVLGAKVVHKAKAKKSVKRKVVRKHVVKAAKVVHRVKVITKTAKPAKKIVKSASFTG